MKTFINFDLLKVQELYLHTILSRAVGIDKGQHEVALDTTDLMPQYKLRITKWATRHAPPPVAPTPAEPQVSMAQLEAEQKQSIQHQIDKTRALQRAEDYVRDAGLVNSEANGKLIRDWVEAAGGWTPERVDAAIIALNDQLEWVTVKEETKPVEVFATLSDGKPQLPLDASPSMLRRASLPQLHDWHRRKSKATPVAKIAGRFAGNIF